MSLYNKYRPSTFEEVKGNSEIIETIKSLLSKKEAPHTILLSGSTGTGKTTIARIIAKELKCDDSEIREINASDKRGIDDVREIISVSQYKPLKGLAKVWIIDESHRLTPEAQDAALKILEQPPSHVYFILCTTEPNKLKSTILNRCQKFEVQPLNDNQMFGLLRSIVHNENEKLDKTIYDQIVQDSLGCAREAIQTLEKVLAAPVDKRLEIAQKTAEKSNQVIELCRALANREKWSKVGSILSGLKDHDPEEIRRIVLGYAKAILIKSDHPQAAKIIQAFWEPTYNIGMPGVIFMCYESIKN